MLSEAVRELYNKIMAKRHRLAKIVSHSLEKIGKPKIHPDKKCNKDDPDSYFRGLMERNRLWRETRNYASVTVRVKILYVVDQNKRSEELIECLTDFYHELVKDIELIGGLNVERD